MLLQPGATWYNPFAKNGENWGHVYLARFSEKRKMGIQEYR